MKAFYQILALIALFLMLMQSMISFATPPEEATVSELEQVPEKWRIDVIEDNFYFSKGDEEKLKTDVLGFFKQAESPTYSKLEHYFNSLASGYKSQRVNWLESM